MSQWSNSAFPMPFGSSQYILLIVSLPSLNFISWQDNAGNSAMEPKGTAIKIKLHFQWLWKSQKKKGSKDSRGKNRIGENILELLAMINIDQENIFYSLEIDSIWKVNFALMTGIWIWMEYKCLNTLWIKHLNTFPLGELRVFTRNQWGKSARIMNYIWCFLLPTKRPM